MLFYETSVDNVTCYVSTLIPTFVLFVLTVRLSFLFLTGAVYNASALFTYDTQYLLDTYNYAPRHDHTFIPVFSVPVSPDDPLGEQASEICSGEGARFCRCTKKIYFYSL